MSDLQERAKALADEALGEIQKAAQVVADAKLALSDATANLHVACEIGDRLGLARVNVAEAAGQSENTVGQWIREERGIEPKKRKAVAEQVALPESEPETSED